jgi:hypothetical protein
MYEGGGCLELRLVFKGATPFVLMGSAAGMPDALKKVASFGVTTLVLGHGEVCGPEVIDQVADYLRFVQRLAEDGHWAGLSPLEAAREADLGSSPTCRTPSASSATCTVPTPSSRGPHPVRRSI